MNFMECTEHFINFLNTVDAKSVLQVNTSEKEVGFVVSPWLSTSVPWFTLTLLLLYRTRGFKCTIIWDDLFFENEAVTKEENGYIEVVLGYFKHFTNIIKVSDLENIQLSLREIEEVDKLAIVNAIWTKRTSVFIEREQVLIQRYREKLGSNLKKIKAVFTQNKFDHIVCPGGVYGNSGLFLLKGKAESIRIATYDCGDGALFLGSDDAASYFKDTVRALQSLHNNSSGIDQQFLDFIIKEAKEEFNLRLGGLDKYKYQAVGTDASLETEDFEVLIPLSIDWDAPALDRNKFFGSPSQLVSETVHHILNNSKVKVVIRQHPYNRFIDGRDSWEDFIKTTFVGHEKRVIFVKADAKINTYELLKKCKLVLPYVSTIGIEAIFFGKPVIIESNVHYSSLNAIVSGKSKEDYFAKIIEELQRDNHTIQDKDIDEAYLYYYLFQIASFVNSSFTPQPQDYEVWVKRTLKELTEDEHLQVIMESLITTKPVALINVEKLYKEKKVKEPVENVQLEASAKKGDLSDFVDVSFGKSVQLIGMRNIEIGKGTVIGDDTWLNICQRDDKIRMKIGKCTLIGRRSMVSTGGYLEIGDYCVFAPNVYVSDADHVYQDITLPIMQQGATLNRSVIVEDNCWLGINVVVSGNVIVGRGSVIAANSVVLKDVPPFSVVAGNPAKVIKMYNSQTKVWDKVKSEDVLLHLLRIRTTYMIPSKEEYSQILAKNAKLGRIDPIVGGNGICI